MKNILILFTATLMFIAFSGSLWEASSSSGLIISANPVCSKYITQEQNTPKEFKVKTGQKLTVELKMGGSIKITGWNKNFVSVDNEDENNFDIKQTGNGIDIHSNLFGGSNHHGKVVLEVKVPSKFDLDLHTTGGSITINNVDGEMRGRTMGGDLDLSGLKGNLELSTMGGKINLSDSHVDGKVSTMGGKVDIENVVGNVKGSSMGGNVIMKNVTRRDGESVKNEVNISSMGGDINVSDAPNGARVSTMGGSINIGNANKFVKAKTMGGSIELNSVSGWIEATTMGGDITAEMVGDPAKGDRHVKLTSMGGDITLTVPAGLSMDVDVTLAYTKDSRHNYKIKSDFNLNQKTTSEWEYKNGSPRKYIYGTGNINGGKNKIVIETINGNVYLKKG